MAVFWAYLAGLITIPIAWFAWEIGSPFLYATVDTIRLLHKEQLKPGVSRWRWPQVYWATWCERVEVQLWAWSYGSRARPATTED